jgi:ornithine cyclodeaminase
MDVLVINQAQVRQLLSMERCIEVMQDTLCTLGRGDGVQPLRSATWLPDRRGLVGVMPAYLGGAVNAPGVKVITVFPGNHGGPYDAHQGAVLLFEGESGCLRAVLDATELTSIRTAAVSGVATRALARENAKTLGIFGSGVQARTHLQAMLAVRPIEKVWVWSRSPERARKFAASASARHGIDVVVPDGPQEAAAADIVCTTTSSNDPVLMGEWLSPGVHVNAVGACTPKARELDTRAILESKVFVDRMESALKEAGDLMIPLAAGDIDERHILGEVGDVLLGDGPGRTAASDQTMFKSLGIGVEDVAAAHYIYGRAIEEGLGTSLEFGGERIDAD